MTQKAIIKKVLSSYIDEAAEKDLQRNLYGSYNVLSYVRDIVTYYDNINFSNYMDIVGEYIDTFCRCGGVITEFGSLIYNQAGKILADAKNMHCLTK